MQICFMFSQSTKTDKCTYQCRLKYCVVNVVSSHTDCHCGLDVEFDLSIYVISGIGILAIYHTPECCISILRR